MNNINIFFIILVLCNLAYASVSEEKEFCETFSLKRSLSENAISFEKVEKLFLTGIINEKRYYSVHAFPKIFSKTPINEENFYINQNVYIPSMYHYMYDKFDNMHERLESPKRNLLKHINKINPLFQLINYERFVLLEVTPNKEEYNSKYYILLKNSLINDTLANPDQIQSAIYFGKSELKKDPLGSTFIENLTRDDQPFYFSSSTFNSAQKEFLIRNLGLSKEKHLNYTFSWTEDAITQKIEPIEITPFQYYLTNLPFGEKVRIIVGRGQLSSRSELENMSISCTIPIRNNILVYSIDKDFTTIPDLLADICEAKHLISIPASSVDEIYFDGVTYTNVYNVSLFNILREKIKPGGRFITNYTLYTKQFSDLINENINLGIISSKNKLPLEEDYFLSDNQAVYYTFFS